MEVNAAALIGALVGMARAADPGDLSEEGAAIAVAGLALSAAAEPDADATRALIERAHAEKYARSPGCRDCQHPCGRTADFDLRELGLIPDAEVRALRLELLRRLQALAAALRTADGRDAAAEAFLGEGLMGFAHEFTAARLRPLIAKAEALTTRLRADAAAARM